VTAKKRWIDMPRFVKLPSMLDPNYIPMNYKQTLLLIIGLLASSFASIAQNTPVAGDPAAGTTITTNAAPAAEAAAPGVATPAGSAQPGAMIPIIVMDEARLTDAIRNLARMAGMNYLLDPATGFNQLGPDGKVKPEPTVSIRWENVTAEQALQALLNNYQLQAVEDPKSRIVRITNKDPLAPPPLTTKVIQLKYASPTNIVVAVQNTLTDKRSKVVADIRTSQLVVLATEVEQADVDLLVERLDTATKQVLIEARLLEMTMNPTTSKGIDWSGTLENQHVTWGNGFMTGTSTTSIPGSSTTTTLPGGRTITTAADSTTSTVLNSVIGSGGLGFNTASGLSPAVGFLNADGVKAVLSFINKEADAKTISTPRTVKFYK
jgi:type II secretory pathway component GspD/PulD (secretin)